MDCARYGSGLRLVEKKMNVLGHHHVSGHHEAVAPPHSLQGILEEIARSRCAEMLQAVITTEGEKVEILRVFVTDEPDVASQASLN